MKKILIIIFVFINFASFAQFDITRRKANLDSIRARTDTIHMVSPVNGTVANFEDSVYTSYLYVNDTANFPNPVYINGVLFNGTASGISFGTDGQLPYMNSGGTDYLYSPNFTFNGNTLVLEADSGATNVLIGKNVATNIENGAENNTALGERAGESLTTGNLNTFIGRYAGKSVDVAGFNTFVGASAGFNNNNVNNVCIGYRSGYSATGNNNVFIGKESGFNETGSNKLYIENSSSTTPLIGGDFSTDELTFNVDTTHNKGHLIVDSTLEVSCSQIVLNKLDAHAYLPVDSAGETTTTTADVYNFVQGNFINDLSRNVKFDTDTLQVDRPQFDSVYVRIGYTVSVSADKNGANVKFGFSNNGGAWPGSTKGVSLSIGETKSVTHNFRKWLKNNDDIKFVVKSSIANTTITITEADLELEEKYTSKNYNK